MTAQVSVVVPTCRRRQLLERCLEALEQQDIGPSAYEIIVVDDAAEESTRQFVNSFAQRAACGVRYFSTGQKRGPAAARNLGWHMAAGQIIAFTDDDCLPCHDWLRRGVSALAMD